MFESIINTATTGLQLRELLICTGVSLICGLGVSVLYMYKNIYNKGFVISLVLMPAIVQVIIMMVNGNLGTGVAVVGAFSLIRFRSVPGSSREIITIFLAMAVGLATGMGYVAYALMFVMMIGGASVLLYSVNFGQSSQLEKDLRVMIPESLDYEGIFDDLFQCYTSHHELLKVKTTNMGSMYELQYHVHLRKEVVEKEFLDELRCRNGNLNIVCGRVSATKEEL